MVAINKQEAEQIRARFPVAVVTRVNRQHSCRHRYYVSEETVVLNFLDEYRRTPKRFALPKR